MARYRRTSSKTALPFMTSSSALTTPNVVRSIFDFVTRGMVARSNGFQIVEPVVTSHIPSVRPGLHLKADMLGPVTFGKAHERIRVEAVAVSRQPKRSPFQTMNSKLFKLSVLEKETDANNG